MYAQSGKFRNIAELGKGGMGDVFLTVAAGALRPSSFSPWRLTQITGTFIFSTGAMSVA